MYNCMSNEMNAIRNVFSFVMRSRPLAVALCMVLSTTCYYILQSKGSDSLLKMSTRTDTSETTKKGYTPLFSFGIVADVQYAETNNGMNFEQTSRRFYRNSINILENAIRGITNYGSEQTSPKVDSTKFILQLGDLLDGKAKRLEQSKGAMQKMEKIFSIYPNAIYHIIGNHDYYNFNRQEIQDTFLRTTTCANVKCQRDLLYYHKLVHPGVRLVVIDCYDVSILGYGSDTKSEDYIKAMSLIKSKNTNDDLNSSENLPSENVHYTAYNGAVGKKQLEWLHGVLSEAEKEGETVIVAGHVPVYFPVQDYTNILWNHQEVLDVLQRYSSVVAYFCGHDHNGSLRVDDHGIHHYNVQGIIETPPGTDAYGVVHVYPDRLEVQGYGRVPSCALPFRNRVNSL